MGEVMDINQILFTYFAMKLHEICSPESNLHHENLKLNRITTHQSPQATLQSADTLINLNEDILATDKALDKPDSKEVGELKSPSDQETKNKLALAIKTLNVDQDTLKDLEMAFDCSSGQNENSDVASALLHLGGKSSLGLLNEAESSKSQKPAFYEPKIQPNRIEKPRYYPMHHSPYPPQRPARYTPLMTEKVFKQQFICQIHTKTVKLDNFVDIWISSPKFETRHYRFEMIRIPSAFDERRCRNAIMIIGMRSVLVNYGNGNVVESIYRGQQVVHLDSHEPNGPISVIRMNQGNVRLRIPIKP